MWICLGSVVFYSSYNFHFGVFWYTWVNSFLPWYVLCDCVEIADDAAADADDSGSMEDEDKEGG